MGESEASEMDLKALEQKIYTRFHDDGLADILVGMWFLVAGMGIAYDISFLISITPPLAVPVWVVARKLITIPRMGNVKFGIERQKKLARAEWFLPVIGFVALVCLSGFYFRVAGNPEYITWLREDVQLSAVSPLLVIVAGLIGLIGSLLDLPRFYKYAGFIVAFVVVGHVLRLTELVYMFSLGALIVLNGSRMLNRFIVDNPLPEMNGTEEAI
ncbi:MAG: hypothetical protein QF415_02260 [Candidatus Undinarchaeales archaeon]|jgi:hypothetical protein|nr:hypothetical protein [Candidatus Undinarchaeales archaeon]MDP7492227.1 hypothetical protein [Candidatus Undinarchaeales archaeon]